MTMQNEGPNEAIFRNFEQAARTTSKVAEVVTEHGSDGSRPGAIYLAIGCVSGALNILAMCVGCGKDEPRDGSETPADCDVSDRINSDTLLFSAILTALSVRDTKGFKNGDESGCAGTVCFGPSVILEAMQMYERATGTQIDGKLPVGMVRAARELEGTGAVMVSDFLETRRKKMN